MKNLLVYIHPNKYFDVETDTLARIQIDNSLELGWKKQDIMMVTNFHYEYRGVKSLIVNSDFCGHCAQASKINAIVDLFNQDIIEDEIYWFHDFDAYQDYPITVGELNMKTEDMALADYGRIPRWNTGSVFFRKESKDIFDGIKILTYLTKDNEELALGMLTDHPVVNKRVKRLNITYNFQRFNAKSNYKRADKPLKVLHFHPGSLKELHGYSGLTRMFDFYAYGRNKLNMPLMSERLIKVFNRQGWL